MVGAAAGGLGQFGHRLVAVESACPPSLRITDANAMEQLADRISHYTCFSIGDKASRNILWQTRCGQHFEADLLPSTGEDILCFFDASMPNLRHRCRLLARSLEFHTMTQRSIANVLKLAGVRKQVRDNVEAKLGVAQVSRPPHRLADLSGPLAIVGDILYKLNSPHHLRGYWKASRRIADLCELAAMVFGNLHDGNWEHYCWGDIDAKPCCGNVLHCRDKTSGSVTSAVLRGSGPIPAEPQWANTLANLKECALMKCVSGIGADSFPGGGNGQAQEQLVVDGQAADGHQEGISQTRLSRPRAHYDEAGAFYEFVTRTLVVGGRPLAVLLARGPGQQRQPRLHRRCAHALGPEPQHAR